jgi:transposase
MQRFPREKKIFGDGGYAGPKLASALVGLPVELEIVKRTDLNRGFKVLRRRWVIEGTFSWLRRNRRLMAHYEVLAMIAIGFAKLANDSRLAEAADGGDLLIYRKLPIQALRSVAVIRVVHQ